jgi:hypothetical protein
LKRLCNECGEGQEIFLSPNFQKVALVATHSPIPWVLGGSFHRGKAAGGCEVYNSHPPSARVKNENSYTLPMLYDNFTFTSEILYITNLNKK